MMTVSVKHSGSVTVAQDEGKDAYFKQHSQLIQMCAKINKFLFYLQHNNRTWTEILFQLSAQKMMAYVDKELQIAFTHLRKTPTATIIILNGTGKSRD